MNRAGVRAGFLLLALTAAAVSLHGYHFGIEDQTLYLPAIEKALDPALFPHDAAFILTQARFTAFDELMAWAVRITHVRLDVAIFGGHIAALFLLLFACARVARRSFSDEAAVGAGLLLLIIVLPLPVAGTRLGLMEQYLHPRGLAIALVALAFLAAIEQRLVAVPYLALATAIHPLTGLWGVAHVAFQVRWRRWRTAVPVLLAVGLACCQPLATPPPDSDTDYWRTALAPENFDVRYPLHWPWYEWAGVVAPLALLAYFAVSGRRRGAERLAAVTGRLFLSGVVGVVVAVAITAAPSRRWPVQPMRELHLVYIIAMVCLGARIEQRFLQGRPWRRAAFFVPLTVLVLIAQRHFPASPYIEWPGEIPRNSWVEAFDWAGSHTPPDALFALDPFYLRRPGPDSHSFRAFARRSMLAEAVHDLAPAAMSPELSARWMEESKDQAGWRRFTITDFTRLKRKYGVAWVVVAQPGVKGLRCPFTNEDALVCAVD